MKRRWIPAIVALMAVYFLGFGTGTTLGETGVRLTKPRIEPAKEAEWTDAQREYLAPLKEQNRLYNVFTTFGQNPELAKRFSVFGGYILSESSLDPRHRELVILRMGWLCKAEYEWSRHAIIARRVGLSDEEIKRITLGPDAPGWDPFEANLLRATDELHDDAMITDATWAALAQKYTQIQMMDLVFTAGQYNLVSMALNSFGVQLDEGVDGFPK